MGNKVSTALAAPVGAISHTASNLRLYWNNKSFAGQGRKLTFDGLPENLGFRDFVSLITEIYADESHTFFQYLFGAFHDDNFEEEISIQFHEAAILICFLDEKINAQEKLTFLFQVFDIGSTSYISFDDLSSLTVELQSHSLFFNQNTKKIREIFKALLADLTQQKVTKYSFEEWVSFCSANADIMTLLEFSASFYSPEKFIEGDHDLRVRTNKTQVPCNVCRTLITGDAKKGLVCNLCDFTCHVDCVDGESLPGGDIRTRTKIMCRGTSVEQTFDDTQPEHHWIECNLHFGKIQKCACCGDRIKPIEHFYGIRCSWCKLMVHTACKQVYGSTCSLGQFGNFVIPPTNISRMSIASTKSQYLRKKSKSARRQSRSFARRFRTGGCDRGRTRTKKCYPG